MPGSGAAARLAADAVGNGLHPVAVYVVLHSCMVGEADWVDCKGFAAKYTCNRRYGTGMNWTE